MPFRNDPEYQKLVRITKLIKKRHDFEKAHKEVLNLHGSRISTNLILDKKRYDPLQVYDAVAMDMAYRGRLVTMLKKIRKDERMLSEAIYSLQTYLTSEYPDYIKGTRDYRQQLLDRICATPLSVVQDCLAHIETIEHVIKDIDQANFQFRHLVTLLQMFQEKGARNI